MKKEVAEFLTSVEGRAALAEVETRGVSEATHLSVLTGLRRTFSPEIAGALVQQAMLRQKAARRGKFSQVKAMFFTAEGLEQASSETVAHYRAERMRQFLPTGAKVADFCCSIGGDTLGLARYFSVSGVDLDEARLVFAAANCAAYGVQADFLTEDITKIEVKGYEAIFFDPARRTNEGRRLFSVEDYRPPLSLIKKWLEIVPEVVVKTSPGVDYAELAHYDCEVEIISEEGEVKEAVLWFGKFKQTKRRATLLPGLHSLTYLEEKPAIPVGEPLLYLYEPDGAVIRAGLVEELALQMGGSTRKLDPDIAFLTSNESHDTPFARRFRILESQPWNLKKLNRRLQELKVGKVVVKKRGSPVDPQQLEKALNLKGQGEMTVVLTHVLGQPYVLLCEV